MKTRIKGVSAFCVMGMLFTFFCLTEGVLAKQGNILWNAEFVLRLLSLCLAAGVLCGVLFLSLLTLKNRIHRTAGQKACPLRGRTVFFISLPCIVLCWLPGYLAYYPAICSYDTTIQLAQVINRAYNDHHPILHTLLLEGAVRLGSFLGDVNTGIGLYALMQLFLLATAFAFGIAFLKSEGVSSGLLALLLIYCCIFPFHHYMSVTLTKDTLFTAFFLLQLLFLLRLLKKGPNTLRPGPADILYILAGIGVVLFRTNGKFALLFLFVLLLTAALFWKKSRRLFLRLSADTFVLLAVGQLLLGMLFSLTDAVQGNRREMLSLPIQQLSRTMLYHGGVYVLPEDDASMSDADRAVIEEFFPGQAYLAYRPDIADPVKGQTSSAVVRYKPKEFIAAYCRLFAKYPGEYINAALAVNAGYLSPFDLTHAVINLNGRDRGLGYIQTRWVENELNPCGIYKDSKWEALHGKMEDFADSNGYLKLPVLRYLMVPGSYLWFWMLYAVLLLLKKRRRELLALSLAAGYYITLFLGPTVQLRYLYPLMAALPFAVLFSMKGGRFGKKE